MKPLFQSRMWTGVLCVGMFSGCLFHDPIHFSDPSDCNGSQGWIALSGNFPGALKGRAEHVAIAVNGMIYVGLGEDGNQVFQDWWRFDPVDQSWMRLSDFPGNGRDRAFVFAIGSQIYVGGGDIRHSSILRDVYVYEIPNDRWQRVADLPYEITGAAGTSDGHYGYLFGGANYLGYLSTLLRYDPQTDRWTVIDTLPGGIGRRSPFLIYAGGALYLGTGRAVTGQPQSDVYRYSLQNHSFTALQPYPIPVEDAWPILASGHLYLVGGKTSSGRPTDQFYGYAFQSGTWEAMPPFPDGPRSSLRGGSSGNSLYLGLGEKSNGTFPQDWWMYCGP